MPTIVPVPAIAEAGAARALSAQPVRINAPGAQEIVRSASVFTERAFKVPFECVGDGGDVRVLDLPGAPMAGGADPRPPARAGLSEAYQIEPNAGQLVVRAGSDEALFRALISIAGAVHAAHGELRELRIEDSPRFAWRGLSLDIVRHWFSPDQIRAVIDLLAVLKMNVLHLHLTDFQAWRYEVPGYPELTAGVEHLTSADLDDLAEYACERFVTLVPEVDLPGHTAAVARALPHLAPGPFAHPFTVHLDRATPGVEEFITAAITELVERCDSPYVHVGGDEAIGMPHENYADTVAYAASVVRELGRTPVAWQEAARTDAFGPRDLLQLWVADRDRFDAEAMKQRVAPEHHPLVDMAAELFAQAVDDPGRAVSRGVPMIVSSSDPLYLDRKPSDSSLLAAQNQAQDHLGHPGYPPTPSTSVLDWDPSSQRDVQESGVQVAGVEAALWCESVESFDDAAQLLLPRLALVAQRAWGPIDLDGREVLAATRAQAPAWERLGFGNYYQSAEVFDADL